jgi:hypothetical protein
MKKNLNTYTFILFFTALIGVLLIGGLSLFMVKTIMGKVYLIEKEVKNEDLVNTLHNQTYKLALSIQHSLIVPEEQDIRQISELFHAIDTKLQLYLAYEQQAGYPEAMEEVRLLTLLAANLDGMQRIATVSSGRMPIGVLDQEKLVFLDQHVEEIERIIGEINALHFAIISRKTARPTTGWPRWSVSISFFPGWESCLLPLVTNFMRNMWSPLCASWWKRHRNWLPAIRAGRCPPNP